MRTALPFLLLMSLVLPGSLAGQEQEQFGGAYAGLDTRRQQLVDNWVARFVKTTGQSIEPDAFYDDVLSQSAKTTFDAVTHALMTTRLTDGSGAAIGDALTLVAEVDTVRGEVSGARGDRQFRMYVRLTPDAMGTLERSTQFKRGIDNSVYHKGYPINYRGQGGVPSIQISVALDRSRADIDVDYRSSSFPVVLLNGHLTSSNSDVRAGNNYDRHLNRWTGFQNWWRGFFGVRQQQPTDVPPASPLALPQTPRAGRVHIDRTVHDFLTAWLIEGDIVAAMGYVSDRSYACLARDSDDPSLFDRGVAPFQLMIDLKTAYDSLGPHDSLDGLVVGTRLVSPALRLVRQPHHAQFVLYSVPDDVAVSFDCESQLTPGDPASVRRAYGNYFGATFYVDGHTDTPVSLLWARDQGYWKIVSWRAGMDDAAPDPIEPVPDPTVVRIPADPAFERAARTFLESWLVRHDYDGAFAHISPAAYECYDLERGSTDAPASSPEDAGRKLRASLESSGKAFGTSRRLDAILTAAEPFHPAIRIMDHRASSTFTLTSVPDALGDAAECAARANGSSMPDPLPLEYGKAFGQMVRFNTRGGEAPVLRLLWRRENGTFRITSYGIELP